MGPSHNLKSSVRLTEKLTHAHIEFQNLSGYMYVMSIKPSMLQFANFLCDFCVLFKLCAMSVYQWNTA
jgi:hypothetical protein